MNISAVSAALLRSFSDASSQMDMRMVRYATGQRINRGADDPAGLIASERLGAALEAIDAETRALARTDSYISTADAALGEMSSLSAEAEALAVASANTGGLSEAERAAYQMEADSIAQAMASVSNASSFAGQRVFDGSVEIDGAAVSAPRVDRFDLSDPAQAQADAQSAREAALLERARLGAYSSNGIESRRAALGAAFEATSAARSSILDADLAAEASAFARAEALRDSTLSLLASTIDLQA